MAITMKTRTGLWVLAGAIVSGLAACGNGGSAVETRDRSADTPTVTLTSDSAATESRTIDASEGDEKTPLTANRRETVDAKIERLYQTNGTDFGASSPQDYLDKVTAFTARPPSGVETAARPNGDTLMYHPATNTFAVVARNGSPRTMFKPDNGPDYWAEQKAAAPTFGQRASSD